MTIHLPLALTMGDPAGIGPDITLKTWIRHSENGREISPFFFIGDGDYLASLATHLGLPIPIKKISSPQDALAVFPHALPVLHQPLKVEPQPGVPNPANADCIIGSIKTAVKCVQDGLASAVVTNPIAKEVLYGAGFNFPGHTEFLAHLSKSNAKPVMMLSCKELRVVLATIHVSLFEAIRTLNTTTICEVARITHESLKRDFSIPHPTLAVAGLNPHAGEGGAMGREEIDIIAPAVAILRGQGINAIGPIPPDAMFTEKAIATYDAALCMYHDQGLIPLKAIDFEHGVNTTLGLPFIRTSPDHGTAFDIAGTGQASELSLMAALTMARQMVNVRAGA